MMTSEEMIRHWLEDDANGFVIPGSEWGRELLGSLWEILDKAERLGSNEPTTEYGVERREGPQAGTVMVLWKGEAEDFSARTGWPMRSRKVYKTDWQ